MRFKVKDLIEDELPWEGAIENRLVRTSRWGVIRQIVFKRDGKFWQTEYEDPRGDCDWGPWEGQEEVECTQVIGLLMPVKQWVPADMAYQLCAMQVWEPVNGK